MKTKKCVWNEQDLVRYNGQYFIEYVCCRDKPGSVTFLHKVIPPTKLPTKCMFCDRHIVLNSSSEKGVICHQKN